MFFLQPTLLSLKLSCIVLTHLHLGKRARHSICSQLVGQGCSAAGLLGDSGQLLRALSGKDGGIAWKLGRLELDTDTL